MSNIFDALEQARRERHKDDLISSCASVALGNNAATEPGVFSDASTDVEIVNMFRDIQGQLGEGRWIMQLISTQGGEGVSFVAKRFAKVSATLLNKKVLLVKLVTRAPETDHDFSSELRLQELSEKIEEKCSADVELNGGGLVQVSVPFKSCLNQFKQDLNTVHEVKKFYDIIIFDTPSAANEPNSVEFARYADAVMIVLEAEKTKAFAVQSLMRKLKDNSTALLGVVLNKRYFHIPDSIYSKLH